MMMTAGYDKRCGITVRTMSTTYTNDDGGQTKVTAYGDNFRAEDESAGVWWPTEEFVDYLASRPVEEALREVLAAAADFDPALGEWRT